MIAFAKLKSRLRHIAYPVLICGVAALNAPAQAATATWSPEKTFAQNGERVFTAVNAAGVAVMVWDKLLYVDPDHPLGVHQVAAAVRTASGTWSPVVTISPPDSVNAGATVDPATGLVQVFWTTGGASYLARSKNFGASWGPAEAVPAGTGFLIRTNARPDFGPFVQIDGAGNTTVIAAKPHDGAPGLWDVEALVRTSAGTWSGPVALGTAGDSYFSRLKVISDGQALFNLGIATFRRAANGTWSPRQDVQVTGLGALLGSATLDASGKGYLIIGTASNGDYLSTQFPGQAWSAPTHVPKLDPLVVMPVIEGSSGGHVMVAGVDHVTNAVRAAVSIDGGATWGPLASFGAGAVPQGGGSESGLYVLAWNGAGTSQSRSYAIAGTGVAGATSAWAKTYMAGNYPVGWAAIAGVKRQSDAKMVAGWLRGGNLTNVDGVRFGTVTP